MSVVGSLLINGSAGQELGVTGEGRWKVLGGFYLPWDRWVVTTCGHPARGICSACSSLLVLLFALSGGSLLTFCSFYLGSGG